ncbi:MAG: DUF4276 family protein [Deltaproteobacteria bacterium]|nr:DUF4276 family protein [Deltaproteobacteria bacterium]
MSDVYIVVEGQTEQTFIRDVLAPEMGGRGLFLFAVLVGKPGHKGGDIRFERVSEDVIRFLKQRPDTYVSTMLDYSRIDINWPGADAVRALCAEGTKVSASQKGEILEQETVARIEKILPENEIARRFLPYVEMHEFEALLFSNAEVLVRKMNVDMADIMEILGPYDGPEEINSDPEKTPSKRLLGFDPAYRKVAMGRILAAAVGVQEMRLQCPHFDGWLARLEGLES